MIEAVLFDMDGLLLDSERVNAESVLACAKEMGWVIPWETVCSVIGTNSARTDALFSAAEPAYDGARMHEKMNAWLRARGYDARMPLKPFAAETVKSLKARGLRLALVTSTDSLRAERNMRSAGLWECFDAVVTGDLGLPSKPAPDVFLRGAELLGVDISRCAVFEDSYNGLRAGRAAGALTVMVPDMLPYREELAPFCDHVAENLREAEEWICR
ncbi:MAG: HAD family phosphatase [Clostridia bacterium]|nr:HAD family phosphatase [Clostridia bacterium]